MDEIDKAIALDPWDPELLNFKSAWCILLGELETALTCAERASDLRPSGYPKPRINRANVLFRLGREKDARDCAQAALKEAESLGDPQDIQLARWTLNTLPGELAEPSPNKIEQMIAAKLWATQTTSRQEIGQFFFLRKINWFFIVDLVRRRIARLEIALELGGAGFERLMNSECDPAIQQLATRLMAELLTDYSSETTFQVVLKLALRKNTRGLLCLALAIYLTLHSEGVMRRDAARFVLYSLLGFGDLNEIRQAYRQFVRSCAFLSYEQGRRLQQILRDELNRTNSHLSGLFDD
ncbi:MAG: tetratricopeptide repeat protein [Isosphaerales bacterium]